MNLWRLNSLQKLHHQRLYYPPFKLLFFTPSTQLLLCFSKFIQTLAKFSSEKTRAILSLIQKGISLQPPTPTLSSYQGKQVHAHITKSGFLEDSTLRNHLINLCSKCQVFRYARNLFDGIPYQDLVSWSALISGYAQNGLGREAISVFNQMYALGFKCNEFTFSSVLKACSITKDLNRGKQIHGIVISTGYDFDVFVANTLVVMYAKCGELFDCRRLFYEIPERNVVSWNALFSSYVQNDCCEEAVSLFQEMISSGIEPDEFSLSSILNACTGWGDYEQGRRVHGYLIRYGYDSETFSANALLDMYMKLVDLDAAMVVFEQIARPDIVSWNAVIAGCALHGYNDWALGLLGEMKRSGVFPNMFTLSSILKACAGSLV